MSTAPVQVGDVWKDKDKRRNTVIEIIEVNDHEDFGLIEAKGLIVGTENERIYSVDRLVKRWELVTRKADEPEAFNAAWAPAAPKNWHLKMQCSVNGDMGQAFRITMKQLDTFGAPLCGCHKKPMQLVEKH